MQFENEQFIITNEKEEDNIYTFTICIKDFDTPGVEVKYDYNKEKIISLDIKKDDDDNEPKNHVAYKLIYLAKYELCVIFNFLIKHK